MRFAVRLAPALTAGLGAIACQGSDLPDRSSPAYAQAVATFYRGVAAAQAGEAGLAAAAFQRVTEIAPGEPAGWADLGLIALQRRELDAAAEWLTEARRLAPDNSRIRLLSGLLERERGQAGAATQHLREAVALDTTNLKALYLLSQAVAEEPRPESTSEAQRLIEQILAVDPGNFVALLERARLAARLRDPETLRRTLDRIAARADTLSLALTELAPVRRAAEAAAFDRAATQIAFLQSELQPLPAYLDDQQATLTSPTRMDVLLTRFVRLPTPVARSAPADTGLTFAAETLAIGEGAQVWVRAAWLSEEVPLALIAAGRDTLLISPEPGRTDRYALPAGAAAEPLAPGAVAPLDYNYDFWMDFAFAGPDGFRLLRQDGLSTFTNVTRQAVPPAVARGAYAGVWAADLDMEGDLDLVLARVDGAPLALVNRGDGTFEPRPELTGVTGLRDLAWADLDGDGDPDAATLDAAGRLHVFLNHRAGPAQFRPRALPDTLGAVRALTAADWNQDATLDLLVLRVDGTLSRLSLEDGDWHVAPITRWVALPVGEAGSTRMFAADLDNNGDLDLVVTTARGTRAWLRTESGTHPLPQLDVQVTSVADLSGDGRLDLIGVSLDGQPRLLVNRGTRNYFSASIRPRAADVTGDRRINSFGIGGEIEVRAGLLYQKQPIESPVVHFGVGEQPQVDVARILWPNGTVQAEFNLSAVNETVLTRQRLKGSCPWVFTFDGANMQFVTDFLWRTALGLRINAQGAAAVIHSEDWIKIRGDQLAPRGGFYDVRVTAELWETHFFDHIALMVVDHPEGTEVFVDERFAIPAPSPAVLATEPLRPVASARDQGGRDVTALVRARDGRYLDTFELGPYQGIASEHHVEVELGSDAPVEGPLWLVVSGWVYPTDASINVAVTQGHRDGPRGVSLEVADGRGEWTIVNADLGFPAGKTKTMLIDLRNVFPPGAERRLRLRTNMEIYWDQIAWARGLPDAPVATRRLLPTTADLRYRGFSEVPQVGRSTPEIPRYERIAAATPLWRDLVGFHTRFGDVMPLNAAVDDRYTIMNAGDELALRFPAAPPPQPGWTRDFVLIGDGWVKDGDYNTGFSTTVRPLPYHGLTDYSRLPDRLQDDPAYQRHPEDWEAFHTRYVTPREFHRALVPER